jgi:tetratricopeptide (TPR) repeat protein
VIPNETSGSRPNFSTNPTTASWSRIPRFPPETRSKISELSKKGYQLLKENKISEAETLFETILSLDPNNNYALVGIGDGERKRGNYRKAIEHYERCLEATPTTTTPSSASPTATRP